MRNIKRAALVVCIGSFLLSSCYTTKYIAPPNANLKLASKGSACTEIARKRQWFALFGLISISDNDTSSLLAGAHGAVMMEDQLTVVDFLIGIFTIIVTIVPKTVKAYSCK